MWISTLSRGGGGGGGGEGRAGEMGCLCYGVFCKLLGNFCVCLDDIGFIKDL